MHDAQPWVGAPEDTEWRHWLNAVGASRVKSARGQYFSLASIAIEAALNHQGVAMARSALLNASVTNGQLVTPFKQRVKGPHRYYLVYHKELMDRPGMQSVIQWVRERAATSGTLPEGLSMEPKRSKS